MPASTGSAGPRRHAEAIHRGIRARYRPADLFGRLHARAATVTRNASVSPPISSGRATSCRSARRSGEDAPDREQEPIFLAARRPRLERWHPGVAVARLQRRRQFPRGHVDNPASPAATSADRRSSDYWELRGRDCLADLPGPLARRRIRMDRRARGVSLCRGRSFIPMRSPGCFRAIHGSTRTAELRPDRERVALFAAHRWQATDAIVSPNSACGRNGPLRRVRRQKAGPSTRASICAGRSRRRPTCACTGGAFARPTKFTN